MPPTLTQVAIDNYTQAILDRDSGVPYAEVLGGYQISPNQFYRAATRNMDTLIGGCGNETVRQTLADISNDEERTSNLFNMGEEFIQAQYNRVMGRKEVETQKKFYEGTLQNSANIEHLVYCAISSALTSRNPDLDLADREQVVEGIRKFPSNLHRYFAKIKLSGLSQSEPSRVRYDVDLGSPLAILEVFDIVYRRKTSDASLFDLGQKTHLHKWGKDLQAPQAYWKVPANQEEAVYHTFTENHPRLASTDRDEVIRGILESRLNRASYLTRDMDLCGLMDSLGKGEQNSPLAVMRIFDRAFRDRTKNPSLFDTNQALHLIPWGKFLRAPHHYWESAGNRYRALAYAFRERVPEFPEIEREEFLAAVQGLPSPLEEFWESNELGGLLAERFGDSSLAAVKFLDDIFQIMTDEPSIFDERQPTYVGISSGNRIIHE
tara:strand:+ start:160 stop:1464 length:1305 start_codon:yes stop_codon:yes gene_type:complete